MAARGAGGVNCFAYSNRVESGGTVATIVTLRGDGTTGTFDVPSGSVRPYDFALPSYEGFGVAVDPATRQASSSSAF